MLMRYPDINVVNDYYPIFIRSSLIKVDVDVNLSSKLKGI